VKLRITVAGTLCTKEVTNNAKTNIYKNKNSIGWLRADKTAAPHSGAILTFYKDMFPCAA
jgi:hypothetical protein